MPKLSPSLVCKKNPPQKPSLVISRCVSPALAKQNLSHARAPVRFAPTPSVRKQRLPDVSHNDDDMVLREFHPLNSGRQTHFIGKIGKKYSRGDYVGPIVDSMHMMYAKLGWQQKLSESVVDDRFPHWVRQKPAPRPQSDLVGTTPVPPKPRPCSNCDIAICRNDFLPTADKSHLVCRHCGAVSAPLTVSTDRERNCSRDEDKTTHADKPFERSNDPFAQPMVNAAERKRQAERDVSGTRISKKARDKYGIGYAVEHSNRVAANEEIERQRQEMTAKDYNKGKQIIVELEKHFVPLEKMDDEVKRFCRKEADRLWREAVRHATVCCADARCQYRLKDRPVAVIAQVSLACSLNSLAQGTHKLERVNHGHIVALNTRLRSGQPTSVSCGYRAVEQVVRRLAAHEGPDPVPTCPLLSATPSPVLSSASSRSVKPSLHASPVVAKGSLPVTSSESSSDLEETAELLQLRDSICKVARYLSCAQRVQRAALSAIQDTKFRNTALSEKNGSAELAYSILDMVSVKLTNARLPATTQQRLGKLNVGRIAALKDKLHALLPEVDDGSAIDEDGLF